MQNNPISTVSITDQDWYSEEFVHSSMARFLKENGYKVQKDPRLKENEKAEKIIVATKFFKKEIIEVKGYPVQLSQEPAVPKSSVKSWFSEALLNSFVNFGSFKDAEIAMALPNIGRYKIIINNLNDYFTVNDLYFKIYLVNEDGSVEVSNLNQKFQSIVSQ